MRRHTLGLVMGLLVAAAVALAQFLPNTQIGPPTVLAITTTASPTPTVGPRYLPIVVGRPTKTPTPIVFVLDTPTPTPEF